MTKNDLSSRHFQRKISEFCELRIAPFTSKRVLENVRPYLLSLIIYRKSPPFLNGHIDWATIGHYPTSERRLEDTKCGEVSVVE